MLSAHGVTTADLRHHVLGVAGGAQPAEGLRVGARSSKRHQSALAAIQVKTCLRAAAAQSNPCHRGCRAAARHEPSHYEMRGGSPRPTEVFSNSRKHQRAIGAAKTKTVGHNRIELGFAGAAQNRETFGTWIQFGDVGRTSHETVI